MIVDPDFLDHWKTHLLINSVGDQSAPIYVLRLWAHCQNRRQSYFENLTSEALKALCRFPGAANKLESSLVASGFIRREGSVLIVCNWDEYNSTLIAAWENGRRGGRPKKPIGLKTETQKKPTGFPRDTQRKPTENPDGTDKMGLDKIRLDEIISIAFDEWYELYPRKIGRDKAEKAFHKALATIGGNVEAAIQTLMEASKPRFVKLRERESQFIPHPASWLNARGWADDIDAIAPQSKSKFGPGQTYDPQSQASFGDGF